MVSSRGQDWWLYTNHLRHLGPGAGGLYLDIAANDPVFMSNTFVLDHCLGWAGLCVEPSPLHHRRLAAHRTCELLPTCLSDAPRAVSFQYFDTGDTLGAGLMDGIEGVNLNAPLLTRSRRIRRAAQTVALTCTTVAAALRARNVTRVGFVSLDVEGHEAAVLRGIDFAEVTIDVLLVERNTDEARQILLHHGYQLLPATETHCSDDFFIRKGLQWGFLQKGTPMLRCNCTEFPSESHAAGPAPKQRKHKRGPGRK